MFLVDVNGSRIADFLRKSFLFRLNALITHG